MREKLLTAKQVAEMLNEPLSTFYNDAVKRGLHPINTGAPGQKRRLRWKAIEIENFLALREKERDAGIELARNVLRMNGRRRSA